MAARSTLKLRDQSLLIQKSYIDGQWVDAQSGKTFSVQDPATNEEIGRCPESSLEDLDLAIRAADRAFKPWRRLAGRDRARVLRRWFDLIIENKQDLAAIIAAENGKSRADAEGEVMFAAGFVEWYSEEAARIYGDVVPHSDASFRVSVVKEPIGVCGLITPWNFPAGMITRKAAPALAVGCTVVIKTDGLTPLTANALAALAEQAGIPKGVLNVVTALKNTPELGLALCESNIVRKISFTGSTRVGKILAKQSADTLKKLSLELGGNAPFIIFDDADLELAVSSLVACKWKTTGQTCSSANRIYVQSQIYDAFSKRFAEEAQKLRVGPSCRPETTHGPLIHAGGVAKAEEHLQDALQKGASVIAGGKRPRGSGNFFEPTVVTNVTDDMKIAHEETFGPIAALFKFSDENEVVDRANNSDVGLAAYVISQDLSKAYRVADQLETGMVAVNTGTISNSAVPFGGVKHSGVGREGGKYGVDDYLITKSIVRGGVISRANL